MSKNDVDIDSQILKYIDKEVFIRPELLINHFATENPKKRGSKGTDKTDKENKKCRRTIQRKLEQMKKPEGAIVSLNKKEMERYGIKNDTDGRAKYLTLKKTVERGIHLDQVFESFSTGDDIDKKMVLAEIIQYHETYFLSPSQLDILVLDLDSEDPDTIESLVYILHDHAINKKINPENETIFLEKLRSLLEQYAERYEKSRYVRKTILEILGYYKDKTVLEQLKKDVEAGTLANHRDDYSNRFTVRLTEEGRTELFNLEKRLRKKRDPKATEIADVLNKIRCDAASVVEMLIKQGSR